MDNTRRPRWSKWRLMPEVKAWEAVALSLNIEPEKVKSDSNAWMGAQFPFDEGDEFNDRLSIVVANIWHPAHFPTACTLSLNGGYLCGVRLAEFATFGVSYAEWDLPSEFAALAAHDDAETIPVKPAPVAVDETPTERRARLLQWREEEEKRGRGALARVVERESKRRGKPVDRSNIGTEIQKARDERDAEKREGKVAAPAMPTLNNPFGMPTARRFVDGKHQD